MEKGPKNKPTSKIHIQGSTPEQRKKDASTFAKLFPEMDNPYAKGVEKKKDAAKKALAKLPGGKKGKEYVVKNLTPKQKEKQKKLMDELTSIDIDPKNDKLSRVSATFDKKPKETKVAKKSQKPKGKA